MPKPDSLFPSSNRAFRYGDGIFASLLVRNRLPENLEHHLERLQKGCRVLKMVYPADLLRTELEKTLSVLDSNGLYRLRIQIFRSGSGLYLPDTDQAEVLCETEIFSEPEPRPIRLGIFSEIRLPFNILSGIKHCNRLIQVLAAQYAKEKGFDEVLLPGTSGMAEASSSNLFVVDKGVLITPPTETGCYPGTTRERILNLARKKGMPVKEEILELSDISNAQEIFLCNAISGIRPVGWFRDLEYGEGKYSLELKTQLNQS